jgi:hypothetical protein
MSSPGLTIKDFKKRLGRGGTGETSLGEGNVGSNSCLRMLAHRQMDQGNRDLLFFFWCSLERESESILENLLDHKDHNQVSGIERSERRLIELLRERKVRTHFPRRACPLRKRRKEPSSSEVRVICEESSQNAVVRQQEKMAKERTIVRV